MNLLTSKLEYILGKCLIKIFTGAKKVILSSTNQELITKLNHCGELVNFQGKIEIVSPQNVVIENNVHIGNNAYLDGRGGIFIGENTHISRNLVIHSSSHNYQGIRLPFDDTYNFKPVVIERNVWIGTNVIIIPGVSIGEGAIVGAGTVVTKSIPPFAIVGNQPNRIIKYRDKSHYETLDLQKSYGGISGRQLV
jgi:maltose O-acetyltransferase